MGWNQGWTMLESQVVRLYDLLETRGKKPDKSMIQIIVYPYLGTDFDSGGKMYLQSHDGKFMEQIVVEVMMPDFDPMAYPKDEYDANDESYTDEIHRNHAYYMMFYELCRKSHLFWNP